MCSSSPVSPSPQLWGGGTGVGVAERGEDPAGWRAGPCMQAVLGPGGRSLFVLQPPRAKHQALLKLFSLKFSRQGLEGGSTLLTGHREVRAHVQGQPASRYWSQASSGSCYNAVPHLRTAPAGTQEPSWFCRTGRAPLHLHHYLCLGSREGATVPAQPFPVGTLTSWEKV